MTLTNEVLLYAATHTTEELENTINRTEILVNGLKILYNDPKKGNWDARAEKYWAALNTATDLYSQLITVATALYRAEPPFDPD